jgi:hypothetical protein
MTFVGKLKLAVGTDEPVEVRGAEGGVVCPRLAALILQLREAMPARDREEFFSQEPREILAAIQLSISGGA